MTPVRILMVLTGIVVSLELIEGIKVCKTFWGYFTNIGCYDNPEDNMTTEGIIRRHGYDVEMYNTTTEDGYILTVFRIPSNNTPVFLQHGIMMSGVAFVDMLEDSLAFVLANAGYDVWIGNFRGTRHSSHSSISKDETRFWDFSFHEMGIYDLPAQLGLVSNITGKPGDIIYIGFSMGTSASYVYCSTYPAECSSTLKSIVSLAPIAYMANLKTPLRYLVHLYPLVVNELTYRSLHGVVLRRTPALLFFYKITLATHPFQVTAQTFIRDIFFGFDLEQINYETMPIVTVQNVDAVSLKVLRHYANNIKTGEFLKYDYGKSKNLKVYGNKSPPSYDISKIKVPVHLIYGENDQLGTKENVLRLHRTLQKYGNKCKVWSPSYQKFNHEDFINAKDIRSMLLDHLIEILKSIDSH